MKKYIGILLFALLFSDLFATPIVTEGITYNGEKYLLFGSPLQRYFLNNPDKAIKTYSKSSGNPKGFISNYKIVDSVICLENLFVWVPKSEKRRDRDKFVLKSSISQVFKDTTRTELTWFDGIIAFQKNDSIFEVVHFKNGKLFKSINLKKNELEEYKEYKWNEFTKTKSFLETKTKLKELYKNDTESDIEFTLKSMFRRGYLNYFKATPNKV